MMNKLAGEIKSRNDFVVLTHINPDGDALGSAFAMDMALRALGKRSCVVLGAKLPHKYAFSELKSTYMLAEDVQKKFGCVISVDCADYRRLGDTKPLFDEADYTINIDHHSSNEGFAMFNYIVPEPSSGEIVFDLITALGVPIDQDMAVALYVAISSDTGNFSYENTSSKTFQRCAVLAQTGIPIASIASHLYNERTYESTLLIGKVIDNLRLYYDGRLAVTHVSLDELLKTGASAEDCETVINYARDIETVQMAVFIRQFKEHTHKVSFRSKNEIDVLEIAKRFGGGGHNKASGCAIDGEFDDVLDKVLHVAKEYFG